MNEEIPYEPPGMDEYLQRQAEHNARILRKYGLVPETAQGESAQADSLQRVVQCADCKYWLEKDKGWGQCSEVANHDHIRVLGGVWWPQKTFGCIHGKRKREASTLNNR